MCPISDDGTKGWGLGDKGSRGGDTGSTLDFYGMISTGWPQCGGLSTIRTFL